MNNRRFAKEMVHCFLKQPTSCVRIHFVVLNFPWCNCMIFCSEVLPLFPRVLKNMYLKLRNLHIYKLYGYGLWVRETPSPKQPKIRYRKPSIFGTNEAFGDLIHTDTKVSAYQDLFVSSMVCHSSWSHLPFLLNLRVLLILFHGNLRYPPPPRPPPPRNSRPL